MARIRVKHRSDLAATSSLLKKGPDDKGGYEIDESDVVQAQAHGFEVKHYHEDTDETLEKQEAAAQTDEPEADIDEPEAETDIETSKAKGAKGRRKIADSADTGDTK